MENEEQRKQEGALYAQKWILIILFLLILCIYLPFRVNSGKTPLATLLWSLVHFIDKSVGSKAFLACWRGLFGYRVTGRLGEPVRSLPQLGQSLAVP